MSFWSGLLKDAGDLFSGNFTGLASDVGQQVFGGSAAQAVIQNPGTALMPYASPALPVATPAQQTVSTPIPGAGFSVMAQPVAKTVYVSPDRWHVIVTVNGQKYAMFKPVARALKLWKPRRKPPISVKDWRSLQRADATIKKLKTVEKRAGMVQRARGKSTTRRKTTRR